MAVVAVVGEREPGAPPLPDVLRIGESEGEAPVQLLETHFYAQLIGDVQPQAAGRSKDELFKFITTLQDGTANAFPHLPAAHGRSADIHRSMQQSFERPQLSNDKLTALERRFYDLSQPVVGGLRELPFQPIVKPHVDQARTAFWGAVIRGFVGNGVQPPAFPHDPAAQRQWILDNKHHFANIEHLPLVNVANLRMLLPDILLFRNLKVLTINNTPIVHLPQFLTLLPKLERVSVRGGVGSVDVHRDVFNQFQWDSMVDYLDRQFPEPFGLGQGLFYQCDGHFFSEGPGSSISRALSPFHQTLIVEGATAEPLRMKVREALFSGCSSQVTHVLSWMLFVVAIGLLFWGLQALLYLLTPPLVAYIVFALIVLGIFTLASISPMQTGVATLFTVAWGQQILMALWSSIVYYIIEPLVCVFAAMFGFGWNPPIRNS